MPQVSIFCKGKMGATALRNPNLLRIGDPSIPYGKHPIFCGRILLYIGGMITIEIIWRGAVLLLLAFLTWSYLIGGSLLAGALLLICIPLWLYITLYSLNYI